LIVMHPDDAGPLKACLLTAALVSLAGCWEEIRYTPPEKPQAAASGNPQPQNGAENPDSDSNRRLDQQAP
jgi:hypothetical protein